MKNQKIYAGPALKEVRTKSKLTQAAFASALDVSVSYLNQMENNNRPIAANVILKLAKEFDFDINALGAPDTVRLVADLKEAFIYPMFDTKPHDSELQLVASNAPVLARAILDLHRAHQNQQERLKSFDDALGLSAYTENPHPWEEVRDFFHYCDNYIDSIDLVAERQAQMINIPSNATFETIQSTLKEYGVSVEITATHQHRHYDSAQKTLVISANLERSSQIFQMATQLGLLTCQNLFETTLDMANFHTNQARSICKIGLANYFAGALLMPYRNFLDQANALRHDLESLSGRFSTSIEQVAHRLSTLQRPGHKGIPFFFVRVDQAGTITKRHSATRLQFARFGGACPLWNVHRAFETPGQFLRQFAETPDGLRYFCLAYDVSKRGGNFEIPVRRFAIGLGCEIEHASKLIYADDLDSKNPKALEPIGISCRICPRENCHQRAVPPLNSSLKVDENRREIHAYEIID